MPKAFSACVCVSRTYNKTHTHSPAATGHTYQGQKEDKTVVRVQQWMHKGTIHATCGVLCCHWSRNASSLSTFIRLTRERTEFLPLFAAVSLSLSSCNQGTHSKGDCCCCCYSLLLLLLSVCRSPSFSSKAESQSCLPPPNILLPYLFPPSTRSFIRQCEHACDVRESAGGASFPSNSGKRQQQQGSLSLSLGVAHIC